MIYNFWFIPGAGELKETLARCFVILHYILRTLYKLRDNLYIGIGYVQASQQDISICFSRDRPTRCYGLLVGGWLLFCIRCTLWISYCYGVNDSPEVTVFE